MERSKNLRVEAYAFIGTDFSGLEGSSAAGSSTDSATPAAATSGSNPSSLKPVGLLWNQTISMTTVPWSQNLTLPSFNNTIIPCTQTGAMPMISFPMVQGTAYGMMVKGAGGPGSVKLTTSMTSTACPDGAYLDTQDSIAPGIARCAVCPAIALSLSGDMADCTGLTCNAVVVTGNYTGPYDPALDLSGANSIFGMDGLPQPAYAHYTSPANATISWDASDGLWDMRARDGLLMATRESMTVGNFQGQSGWYNLSAPGKIGGIQAVGVELNEAANLNLCEIEMLSPNGTNLLRSGGSCYSLPISTG